MPQATYVSALGSVANHSVNTREKLNQMIKQRRNSVYDVYGLERNAVGAENHPATFFVPITPDLDKIIRWEFKLRIDSFLIPIAGDGIIVMPATVNVIPKSLDISTTTVSNTPSSHKHNITPNPHDHDVEPHQHNTQVVAGIQMVQPDYTEMRIFIDNIDFTDLLAKQFPLPKGAGIFPDDTLSNRYDIVEACELLSEEQRNKILRAGFHRVELRANGVYSASMIEFIKYSSINRHGNTSDPDEESGHTEIYPDRPIPPNPPVDPAQGGWTQVTTPVINRPAVSGMCLQYVDDCVNAPARQPSAQASWNVNVANGVAHGENPPVGVWIPIYFSINNGQFAGLGHVAWYYSDGVSTQIHDANVHAGMRPPYSSISELMTWMGWNMSYLGWSEVVDGSRAVTRTTRMARSARMMKSESEPMPEYIQPEFGVDVSTKYDLAIEKNTLEEKLKNLTGSKAYIFTETAKIKTALMQIESTLAKIQAIENLKGEPNEL